MSILNIDLWIKKKKKELFFKCNFVALKNIKNWKITNNSIYHERKKFFSIKPFFFSSNIKELNNTYIPLIVQREVGILGIIKRKIKDNDEYLLQAKIEPGNINKIQLSPTVQATKSNYTQVHGGKPTNYINFFLKKKFKILSKFKLAEQGTRYLTKKNYNYLIDSGNYKIKIKDNYKWIKKNELVQLSKRNNFLNMDTLSIISCSIKKIIEKKTILTFREIIDKYSRFNKKYFIERKIISFKDLKKWTIHKYRIFDNQFKYFSIIGLKIITNCREISSWCQPIIKDHLKTFNGILICEKFGTMHYLLKVTLEPGFTKARFTSTVLIKNFDKIKKNNNERYFHFFKKRKGIVLNKKSSDEGGRFYKNEVHNVICLIKEYNIINRKNYLWISHNQINELIKKDMLTLEARNLFGYYNIEKLK